MIYTRISALLAMGISSHHGAFHNGVNLAAVLQHGVWRSTSRMASGLVENGHKGHHHLPLGKALAGEGEPLHAEGAGGLKEKGLPLPVVVERNLEFLLAGG